MKTGEDKSFEWSGCRVLRAASDIQKRGELRHSDALLHFSSTRVKYRTASAIAVFATEAHNDENDS